MSFGGISLGLIILQLCGGYILYFAVKCLYRLTLHPLARFPGPKRAAISRLYAVSWDVPMATSYVKEFTTWHDKYNSPVVRIEPNHLHFRDIDAYNEIFKIGTKFTRDPAVYSFPFTKGSIFNELNNKEGTQHRSLYNQYFSKSAVQNLEPVIQEHLSQFLIKIDESSEKDKSIDLTLGFRCLMADTLMRYCHDKPFDALSAPNFQDRTVIAVAAMLDTGPAASWYGGSFFIAIVELMRKVPRKWVPDPSIREVLGILDRCYERVVELSKQPRDKMTPSVFQTALDPNAKKGQPKLSMSDLAADGLTFFGAGIDTTSNALSFALYHLIRDPNRLHKLLEEVSTVIPRAAHTTIQPTSSSEVTWTTLEKLPYLLAVAKEGIRMSYGVPGKTPRIVPAGGATLSGQFIPAGTAVSSTSYSYFSNPNCYSEPLQFKPERWIRDNDGLWSENGGVDPDKYFVAFSRGSRACIGMNLAYAQLHYTLAYLVRNFEMHIDDGPDGMKDGDMDWHDSFTTATFGHLKVKFKALAI